ncbi:hypothetical protein HCJ66_04230 [Listeria sp. FSL L7-1582]|uniref:hypothetical protein n=1 Tax=Listeria portnoyi TaxID=2713504 RepID=UPI00164D4029|nr:hypothetical protein [Listeria portnoyi]MBC6308759.1 hypothetical protein [Listeria portnoyi]
MTEKIEQLHKNPKQHDSKHRCDPELEQTFYSLLDDEMKVTYDRMNDQKSEAQLAKSATTYMQGFRMGMQVAFDAITNRKEGEEEYEF